MLLGFLFWQWCVLNTTDCWSVCLWLSTKSTFHPQRGTRALSGFQNWVFFIGCTHPGFCGLRYQGALCLVLTFFFFWRQGVSVAMLALNQWSSCLLNTRFKSTRVTGFNVLWYVSTYEVWVSEACLSFFFFFLFCFVTLSLSGLLAWTWAGVYWSMGNLTFFGGSLPWPLFLSTSPQLWRNVNGVSSLHITTAAVISCV